MAVADNAAAEAVAAERDAEEATGLATAAAANAAAEAIAAQRAEEEALGLQTAQQLDDDLHRQRALHQSHEPANSASPPTLPLTALFDPAESNRPLRQTPARTHANGANKLASSASPPSGGATTVARSTRGAAARAGALTSGGATADSPTVTPTSGGAAAARKAAFEAAQAEEQRMDQIARDALVDSNGIRNGDIVTDVSAANGSLMHLLQPTDGGTLDKGPPTSPAQLQSELDEEWPRPAHALPTQLFTPKNSKVRRSARVKARQSFGQPA
jgi:hypothetical protein